MAILSFALRARLLRFISSSSGMMSPPTFLKVNRGCQKILRRFTFKNTLLNEALDQAIFEGVVGNTNQTTVSLQDLCRPFQKGLDDLQLLVDLYANGLENLR